MSVPAPGLRERRLRALGVVPLRLRVRGTTPPGLMPVRLQSVPDAPAAAGQPESLPSAAPVQPSPPPAIRRLALQPDLAALDDPAIARMYASLTEAVGKAGLQCVRPCDVAEDPTAAAMVFGDATAPAGVPGERVLRVDPLAVLHADRARKRKLWERMQAIGREAP